MTLDTSASKESVKVRTTTRQSVCHGSTVAKRLFVGPTKETRKHQAPQNQLHHLNLTRREATILKTNSPSCEISSPRSPHKLQKADTEVNVNSKSSLFLPLVLLSSPRALLFFSPPLQLAFISLMHSGAAAAAEATIGQSLRLLPLKKLARAQPKHALKGQQRR